MILSKTKSPFTITRDKKGRKNILRDKKGRPIELCEKKGCTGIATGEFPKGSEQYCEKHAKKLRRQEGTPSLGHMELLESADPADWRQDQYEHPAVGSSYSDDEDIRAIESGISPTGRYKRFGFSGSDFEDYVSSHKNEIVKAKKSKYSTHKNPETNIGSSKLIEFHNQLLGLRANPSSKPHSRNNHPKNLLSENLKDAVPEVIHSKSDSSSCQAKLENDNKKIIDNLVNDNKKIIIDDLMNDKKQLDNNNKKLQESLLKSDIEIKKLKDELETSKKDHTASELKHELEIFRLDEERKSDLIKLISKENEIEKLKNEISLLNQTIKQQEEFYSRPALSSIPIS